MELKHAILGLLSIRDMSGYDLGRAFAGSVAHFWYADQSQIYRTLDRLSAAGSIDTEVIRQDGKPDRKVHSLTSAGRAELDAWLSSPIDDERAKVPFLARLFFIAPAGRDEALRLLAERAAQANAQLAGLRSIDATGDDAGSTLRIATLRYGIAHAEAELAWLDETRRSIEAVANWPDGPTPPIPTDAMKEEP